MDATRIELKLTLDEVGMSPPTLTTFSERLNLQKRIYLVQILGYDLGYRFSWYLHGPYCTSLTQEAFGLRDDLQSGDKDADDFVLSEDAKKQIDQARKLWTLPAGMDSSHDDWLELLASLHYLKEVAYWPPEQTKNFEAVFKRLIDSKPRFSGRQAEVEAAWERLGQFDLLTSD